MFSVFVLWTIVFIGIFLRKKWVTPVALVTLGVTVLVLSFHMSSDLPLNF